MRPRNLGTGDLHAGQRRKWRSCREWSIQEGLRWGKETGEGKHTGSLSVGKCVHTYMWVPVFAQGRGGMQPPSFVSRVQPQNMQIPWNIYIDRNPSGTILSYAHPQSVRNSSRRWKNTRTTVLPCNKEISVKWLKIYSHPTRGIQKNNTYKDLLIPRLHKPPGFNILNHVTKFKILYLLDTTGKSQRWVLERMKKTPRHLSDLHDLYIPATDCIYKVLF